MTLVELRLSVQDTAALLEMVEEELRGAVEGVRVAELGRGMPALREKDPEAGEPFFQDVLGLLGTPVVRLYIILAEAAQEGALAEPVEPVEEEPEEVAEAA